MFKVTPRNQLFPNNEAKALVKGIINAYAKVYGSRTLLKSFALDMNGIDIIIILRYISIWV